MRTRGRHIAGGQRRVQIVLAAMMLLVLILPTGGVGAATGGPVVLMGIDAEDGGIGGHGPITVYSDVIDNGILTNVTNGGSGILVIGGGKAADSVTAWWDQIGVETGESVTHVNGAAGIAAQSFAGFAMIGVASSQSETPFGGLTDAESDALNARAADIADFVNNGGGLFGTSQTGVPDPYGYLGVLGDFTVTGSASYSNITPTAEGSAVGITDALDICCWHDYYDTYPAFLVPLAVDANNDRVAALGGSDVVLPGAINLAPPTATNPIDTEHTVTATVLDDTGAPLEGVEVDFEVISGPNTGDSGSATTNVDGEATFTWTGDGGEGTDTVQASFLDSTDTTRTATATKVWEDSSSSTSSTTTSTSTPPPPPPAPTTTQPGPSGAIIVEKDAPGAEGDVFVFFMNDNRFVLSDGERTTFSGLDTGSYVVTEETSGGWSVASLTCDPATSATVSVAADGSSASATIALQDGDTITCSFTNDRAEVLGTTVTTAPSEIAADTLPFTGSETGDPVRLALLMLLGGAFVLSLLRSAERSDEAPVVDKGGWSSF